MFGPLKMDFLGGETERRARRTTLWMAVVFSVFVGSFAAIGAGASFRAATFGTTVLEEVGNLPVIADIRRLAWGDASGGGVNSPDNRVTFLLLGIGGEGHEGANLTDTILVATADLSTKKIGILSIPRDTAYPLGGGRFMKINAVNAYAEQDHPGQGASDTAKAMGNLLGVRIDHVVRVDFHGFVTFIDALGGLDVNVERGFTDNQYPTEDFKWKSVSFQQGDQHMDGERALIYVRSRHGDNGEGSDFARDHRQQQVMLAVKEKLLSRGTLTNPDRIMKLYQSIASNVQTDLSPWDLVKLAPLAQGFSRDDVTSNVLDDGPGGELAPANVDGAFMLFPREQDWSEIRAIAQDPFKTREERRDAKKPQTTVHLEIRNGTSVTGFAGTVADRLSKNGYQITTVGNAAYRGYERTVIFDLTNGNKPQELSRLKNMLEANVSATVPSWITATGSHAQQGTVYGEGLTQERVSGTSTDFLVIVGESTRGILDRIGSN